MASRAGEVSERRRQAIREEVSDAAALAKLPAEEQQGFTQPWADVAALLNKAEEKPK